MTFSDLKGGGLLTLIARYHDRTNRAEHLPVESVSVICSEENDDDRGIYDFDTEVISMLVESKDYTIVLLSKTIFPLMS